MNCRSKKPRQGTLVICVLVCLLVASTIVTATTQLALRSRRDIRVQQQMRQTELLLDAGVLRAARQIRVAADYQGESWRPSEAIQRFAGATVEIRVTVDKQDSETRQVEVIASLGGNVDDPRRRSASLTRRSHSFPIRSSNFSPDPRPTNAE